MKCLRCGDYEVRVICSECKRGWCCLECAVNDDAVSRADFDRLDDAEDRPLVDFIHCCRCSGAKPSWQDGCP